jgi:FkbM family methyltransferase
MKSLIKKFIKPFAPIMPKAILSKIPVYGLVCVNLPHSQKVYLQSDGNDYIASLLYWGGIDAFEGNTIRLFIELLNRADTVFDVGANTGLYSLIAARDNPRRMVYAFEPVPRVLNCLRRNIALNKLPHIRLNPDAITDYDGEITLYVPSSPIPTDASTLEGFRKTTKSISVQAKTIDSFVSQNEIKKVDLIKIDTEGTEHKVLKGAKKILMRDEPIIICEVLKGRTEDHLHAVFDSLGYNYFWITDRGLIEKKRIEGDTTYQNMNYLFISNKKREETSEVLKNWYS